MRKPIVITGFMGSGKSRVARELAQHLNLTMLDLDQVITLRQGKSPAQLIVERGEPYFRSIESTVLRELLQTNAARIIALGGGAWIEETNRKLIGEYGCVSVWLDVPFEVCWSRIENSTEDRPLGRTRDQALALYERRRPIYQLASIHAQSLEDLVFRIKTKVGKSN
ncbi:MAG TPA: shikimate kinase [Pyrinomonadaceae bacterium]|nr:shikimate kinase [Pyrinomonadaceae bacterium]